MQNPNQQSEDFVRAVRSVKTNGLHAKGFLQGEKWVQSQLADLKIDRYLAIEHGEDSPTVQLDDIMANIAVLESVLRPSVFNPSPSDPNLFLQSVAADLAELALYNGRDTQQMPTLDAILVAARLFLVTAAARRKVNSCIQGSIQPSSLHVDDILERARHLLSTLR